MCDVGSPPPPRIGQAASGRLRRWLIWLLAATLVLLAGYYSWIFWQVWRLSTHDPETTAFMQSGLERLQAGHPGERLHHRWVAYGQISVNLKRAVIAAEDQKFLDHEGFD